jgi:FKBP12-rapamycin complex-associated protein
VEYWLLVRRYVIVFGIGYQPTTSDFLLPIGGEETIESKRNLFRFYHYAKSLLPNSDMNLMLAASKTLGKIAEIGGAAFGEDFMDYEVPAAIQLLQSGKQEPGGYAGVLILKELARHTPMLASSSIRSSSPSETHVLSFEKAPLSYWPPA